MVRQLRVEEGRALRREGRHRRSSAPASIPASSTPTAALAAKKYFDTIDTIDILDVNAGSHGRYFATNFDPEINFREFVKVWTWIDRQWAGVPDPHGQARRSTSRSSASSRSTSTATTSCTRCRSTSTPTASASGWASATTTSTCSPCCARSACCRTSRSQLAGGGEVDPAAGGQGRAARPAEPGRRLHRQDLHRQRRHGHQGRPAAASCSSTRCPITPRPTPRWSRRASATPPACRRSPPRVLIADGAWDARTDGERRGARPRAVHRPARPDRACRPSTSRSSPARRPSLRRRGRRRLATELADADRRPSPCRPPTR